MKIQEDNSRTPLSGYSSNPGSDLCERMAERSRDDEAIAITEAWRFVFHPASGKRHQANKYIAN